MSDAPPAVRVPAESVLTTAHLSRSAKHNSVGHGPRRDLRPRPDAELVADPLHVAFGGSLRDEQALRYLLVGHPPCDHPGNLAPAAAQPTRIGPFFSHRPSAAGV